jgi:hypothetical protein
MREINATLADQARKEAALKDTPEEEPTPPWML